MPCAMPTVHGARMGAADGGAGERGRVHRGATLASRASDSTNPVEAGL
jgi:hypothetical protein